MKVLLLLALIASSFAKEQQLGTCGFCNLVVSTVAEYASKSVTKQDLLNALTSVSNKVCPQMPKEFISPVECSSFISLYGPYTIDMVLSQTEPSQICGKLQLCETGSDASYTVVFPTIDQQNEKVTYTITQKDVKTKDQKYNYRMFLGSPTFLDEETLTVSLSPNENVDFDFTVFNQQQYKIEVDCPAQSGVECTVMTAHPGRGVWYYVEITAKSFLYNNATEFTLTATVQNEVSVGSHEVAMHRVNILPLLPIIVIAACLCCCCCMRRRKACKRYCQAQKQEPKEVQVAVDMQEMPQGPVVGYYYPPNGQLPFVPQYMPVSVQQMPQPVFIPVPQQQ